MTAYQKLKIDEGEAIDSPGLALVQLSYSATDMIFRPDIESIANILESETHPRNRR